MRTRSAPLTVVTGAQNRDTWFGATAAWLPEGTGAELAEMPGHAGFWTHPGRLAYLVRRIVGQTRSQVAGSGR